MQTLSEHSQFSKQLSEHKQGRVSVQFSLDKPIPYNLIEQILEF